MSSGMNHPATRNSLDLENATIVSHEAFAGDQYLLRLHAPAIALAALAGNFVHLQCDTALPMRRPMSIMRADRQHGWIDILYKAHGRGTGLLAGRKVGERLSVIGPIGVPFRQNAYRLRPLLIGGGVGVPPMIFLSEHMRKTAKNVSPFVIMGSEVPFPFSARPSQIMMSGLPNGVIAAMPLLEDWGIASRLCSLQGFAGCFDGYVTDLARFWLDSMDSEEHQHIELFSCGPTPMLRAVAELAAEYGLPCQISLEEYMACGVGGCAACVVRVETDHGPAMQRVCVDGPVFEAASVFPQ